MRKPDQTADVVETGDLCQHTSISLHQGWPSNLPITNTTPNGRQPSWYCLSWHSSPKLGDIRHRLGQSRFSLLGVLIWSWDRGNDSLSSLSFCEMVMFCHTNEGVGKAVTSWGPRASWCSGFRWDTHTITINSLVKLPWINFRSLSLKSLYWYVARNTSNFKY